MNPSSERSESTPTKKRKYSRRCSVTELDLVTAEQLEGFVTSKRISTGCGTTQHESSSTPALIGAQASPIDGNDSRNLSKNGCGGDLKDTPKIVVTVKSDPSKHSPQHAASPVEKANSPQPESTDSRHLEKVSNEDAEL